MQAWWLYERHALLYIGIGKAVRALITYAEFTDHTDKEAETLIDRGTEYMLRHNLFQRLSNHASISAHITDIMFPQAYMLIVTDLVYMQGNGRHGLTAEPMC